MEQTETATCRRCFRKLRRSAAAGIGPVCARREVTEQAADLRPAAEWQREMPDVVIYDPDGWRGVSQPAWETPITRSEYLTRRAASTVGPPINVTPAELFAGARVLGLSTYLTEG